MTRAPKEILLERKRCFECGATYPKEALNCGLDGTPLCFDMIGRRWKVEGFLRRRAGGGVFAAFHLGSGARAAIDLVPWPLTEDPAIGGRLYGEVQALRALEKHPCVPRLLETGTDRDGSRFTITELGDARSLAELMDEWRRPDGVVVAPSRATQLLSPVISLLGAAHRIGVAHGELDPSSIDVSAAVTGGGAVGGEQVRLRGLVLHIKDGEDAALREAIRADVRAVGVLLQQLVGGQAAMGPRMAMLFARAFSGDSSAEAGVGFATIEDLGRALVLAAPPPVPIHGEQRRFSLGMPVVPSRLQHGVPWRTQQNAALLSAAPLAPITAHPMQKAGLTSELHQVNLLDLMPEPERRQTSETLAVSKNRPFTTAEMELTQATKEAGPGQKTLAGEVDAGADPEDYSLVVDYSEAPEEFSYPSIEVAQRSSLPFAVSRTSAPSRVSTSQPSRVSTSQPSRVSTSGLSASSMNPMPRPSGSPARPVPSRGIVPQSPTAPFGWEEPKVALMPLFFWGATGVIFAALLSALALTAVKLRRPRPVPKRAAIETPMPLRPLSPTPPPFQPAVLGPPPSCPKEMAALPAARFLMGSLAEIGEPNEHPRHPVELSAFCLDRYEVTTAEYRRCERHGIGTDKDRCTPAWRRFADRRRADFSNRRQPVVGVTQGQAAAYCTLQGKRLPTEAEWEYAAAGISGRAYPWGAAPPTCDRTLFGADSRTDAAGCEARCSTSQEPHCVARCLQGAACAGLLPPHPAPVGSHGQNATPEGIQDLAGNVAEWIADFYAERYSTDGTVARNPGGPAIGLDKVVRGGGWLNPPQLLRAAARDHMDPSVPDLVGVGFRCALSPRYEMTR